MSENKVALVTGTSSGIGLVTAVELSNRGYIVIATLRNLTKPPQDLLTSGCDIQLLDVTDITSVDNITTYIRQKYGRCDVLLNNAGYGVHGNMETIAIEDAQHLFDVNVWGVMRMCQKIAPLMRLNHGGLILTVSSTSGIRGLPFSDIYCSSKFAVEGMLESYRYTVFKENIKVAVVNPGPTTTKFPQRMDQETKDAIKVNGDKHFQDIVTVEQSFRSSLLNRISSGESAESCAKAISNVVDNVIDEDVTKGKLVKFWNATAEYGEKIIDEVKRIPDGISGVYERNVQIVKGFYENGSLDYKA